jgi:prepilin-type N-terminal cleavage/methylation domain-containing protein
MKNRGFTLVELTTGMGILAAVLMGSATLLMTGMRSFQKTTTDVDMTNQNSNTMRRISDTLRQAMNVSISNSGKTITFNLPKMGNIDPVTGEKELKEPLQSDGVTRAFVVNFDSGKLTELPSGRVLMNTISPTDPQVGSSQYNQAYTPFQLTSIGSYRAVTINLITKKNVITDQRYMRMKTTAVVRNSQ